MATRTTPRNPPPSGPHWPAYTVERWAITRLKPYDRNARKHSDVQVEQLRGSLRSYGWTAPILAREDGTIIAGHGRLEAGKAEGFTEVPVIVAKGWSDEQCRAYALADNKIALNSSWDDELLGLELADLSGLGVDLASLGFAPQELEELLPAGTEGNTDPDEVPDPQVNPVSRLGDLWLLGRHRLLCGDSTKKADVEREALADGVSDHPHETQALLLMATRAAHFILNRRWIPFYRRVDCSAGGAVLSADRRLSKDSFTSA